MFTLIGAVSLDLRLLTRFSRLFTISFSRSSNSLFSSGLGLTFKLKCLILFIIFHISNFHLTKFADSLKMSISLSSNSGWERERGLLFFLNIITDFFIWKGSSSELLVPRTILGSEPRLRELLIFLIIQLTVGLLMSVDWLRQWDSEGNFPGE